MSEAASESTEHAATPLELFVDLVFVGGVCVFVVAYEVLRHRTHRVQVRHPEVL